LTKNLAGRSLIACPNFDHSTHFSPSPGNIKGQADVSHEDTDLKKLFTPKKENKIFKTGNYLENEDAYSFLIIL
jgi:hypothetical protein